MKTKTIMYLSIYVSFVLLGSFLPFVSDTPIRVLILALFIPCFGFWGALKILWATDTILFLRSAPSLFAVVEQIRLTMYNLLPISDELREESFRLLPHWQMVVVLYFMVWLMDCLYLFVFKRVYEKTGIYRRISW
jgi:hypothetical protein